MLRKLPDINDDASMLDRGRHSALMSARNEACEALRSVFVAVQSAPMDGLAQHASALQEVATRLSILQSLWEEIQQP